MPMNIKKAVDKKWETKTLREILDAPPSALQGLTPEHDKLLAQLNIKNVRDLGEWKFGSWAHAIVRLAQFED